MEVERVLDRGVKEQFPPGAVQRAVLLRHGDDPAIEPGRLMVRVFVPGSGSASDLDAWLEDHRSEVEELRRELSRRLPSARLLEFTFDVPDAGAGSGAGVGAGVGIGAGVGAGAGVAFGVLRITVPDDGSLADEQMSGPEIVTTALALLRENYVFPERAAQAADAIAARLAAGEYDNLDEITLARVVTDHLYAVCDDKHLALRLGGIGPGPGGPAPGPGGPGGSKGGRGGDREGPRGHEARRLAMRQRARLDNFGIRRVERLDGNVGYLDVRRVAVPANAGPAIAAAMELVAGTYALIIDLRANHGGSPEGVVFWCSFLFDEQPTHLNDIFHADTGETRQFWALPYVPGTRYVDGPVYVLASSETFSGGEDFCYTLQALGRAEVIGETTGGGAHPTRGFPISAAMHIAIPFARSINPVTGSNWQGTGVVPDVAVPEAEAYDFAYARALQHVLALDDVPPPIRDEARDALATLPVRDEARDAVATPPTGAESPST